MKVIAKELETVFLRKMTERDVPSGQRNDYLKWLRFYLDFCMKYEFQPRDKDSLESFLQKLSEKRQSPERQKQASSSIMIYYDLMKTWAVTPESDKTAEIMRAPWNDCYQKLKDEISIRQYSPKTLQTYTTWVRQFQGFVKNKNPSELNSDDAKDFLTHLAVKKRVVASTQNQAFNALLFLYRHILKAEYDLKDSVVRAKKSKYIPVVLSRSEVDAVIANLKSPYALAVKLLYGCGLRLSECLNLRVQCLNFDAGILTIHDGKGKKDRTVPLPEVLYPALRDQLERVREIHEEDLCVDCSGVFMPGALGRKWKNASKEYIWQWLFPARTLTLIPQDNERRRYHMHDSELQKVLRKAVRKTEIAKRITCHTFRHSFASHLLCANYDIRTIQQLLGHSDIRTTMIYTHTVKSRTLKDVTSPLDFAPELIKLTECLSCDEK